MHDKHVAQTVRTTQPEWPPMKASYEEHMCAYSEKWPL